MYRTAIGGFHGKTAAVKVLHATTSSDAQTLALLKEISLLAPLHHRNLVLVYGFALHPVPMFVMEYADKGSLWHAIYKDKLANQWSLVQRLIIALQIADAMRFLHAQTPPIVHRDLKPNNVLLCSPAPVAAGAGSPPLPAGAGTDAIPFVPKVCDFGLARVRESSAIATAFGGSFPYLAPEAFRADVPITEAVDVYAYVTMLNELLGCKPPWQGLDQYQLTMAVAIQHKRPALADVSCIKLSHDPRVETSAHRMTGVSTALSTLIVEGWRHVPGDRPTFEDVCSRLRGVLRDLTASR